MAKLLDPDYIALWVGIIGGLIGIVAWYRSAVERYRSNIEKQYAAKREFNHLKEALKSLSANVETLCKMYESQHEHMEMIHAERSHNNNIILTEIKGQLNALMVQLGNGSSQFLNRRD